MATQFPLFSAFLFFVYVLVCVVRASWILCAEPPEATRLLQSEAGLGNDSALPPWKKLQLSIQAGRAKTQLSSTS